MPSSRALAQSGLSRACLLNCPPGNASAFLGPNGAGKSTVIRGIVGRVIPDAGRISVFGSAAGSAEARAALGWVPQDLAVYPRLTCKENLLSFGRYHGLSGSKLNGICCMVSGLGCATGSSGRAGEEPFRWHEAAAQYGGRHHSSAARRADGRADGWRRPAVTHSHL